MTKNTQQESIRNLGKFAQDGTFDKVLESARKGNPVLDEAGLTLEVLTEALNTPANGLESVGLVPGQLEAIVELVGRPPLVVKNDKVEGKTTIDEFFPDNIAGKITRVEKFLPAVGRIEFLNHNREWGGTGWVIDETTDDFLVVTNRHVARFVAKRTFRGGAVYAYSPGNVRYGANIDFVEEAGVNPDPNRSVPIKEFSYLADDISADVAIGRIRKTPHLAHISPLPLADTDGENGETVGLIGYPAYDTRNVHKHMEAYFKGLYDVKRFAPGYLKKGDELGILSHDCTSLGGNSGSPLISLDRGVIVGLHFAGEYRVGNSAVRASTLKGILAGKSQQHVIAALTGRTEAADKPHTTDFFAGREGYDPCFLDGTEVPLPALPAELDLATPDDATDTRPHELRYQHFGVLYSAVNKGPAVTAFNLDGGQFRAIKRHNSTWFHDLRIPRDIQLDREDYGHAKIDRGHLVRRLTTNWGATDEIAKRANLDSYHYTNASPQHASFNRSHQLWLGLENYILNSSKTHGFRANVFTGPIYTPDDEEMGDTGAPLPMHFWKVVTMLAATDDGQTRLHATAYLLSQGQLIQQMLQEDGLTESTEGFVFGDFKTFQVRIRDLETLTRYDFGPLRDFDPLNDVAKTEAVISAKPVLELDTLEGILI